MINIIKKHKLIFITWISIIIFSSAYVIGCSNNTSAGDKRKMSCEEVALEGITSTMEFSISKTYRCSDTINICYVNARGAMSCSMK